MLLEGIEAGRFARLIQADGRPVASNHPAYAYGHLSIYPTRICSMLGIEGAPGNPSGFEELFEMGSECRDDPDGAIYPPMDAITSHYLNGHESLLSAIGELDDAMLDRPNPREGRLREMFPTVGSMVAFLVGPHAMAHLGQVSAWRRFEGLGPVMD